MFLKCYALFEILCIYSFRHNNIIALSTHTLNLWIRIFYNTNTTTLSTTTLILVRGGTKNKLGEVILGGEHYKVWGIITILLIGRFEYGTDCTS